MLMSIICSPSRAVQDDVLTLTLQDVIRMAQELSPDAVQARNSYESAY